MLLELVLFGLMVQAEHEVEHRVAAEDLVADVCAQHDALLVLQDGRGEARPDHQPGGRGGRATSGAAACFTHVKSFFGFMNWG